MSKKLAVVLLSILVAVPMGTLQAAVAAAAVKTEDESRMTRKVKAGIAKLGVGPEARVELKLKNKSKLVGYISSVEEDSFSVTDAATGHVTQVPYPDVTKVQGHNLSTRTKIIIAAAIITGVIITLYIVKGAFCDGC